MDWDEFDHYGRMNWRLNGDLNGLGQGDYCCEVKVLCEEEKGWRYQEKQRGGVCVGGGTWLLKGEHLRQMKGATAYTFQVIASFVNCRCRLIGLGN